ncbi:MAG: EpsG family protein, partial [Oscillospiraceae bacterium]|nr:EpsG family protein [Oscillospiraceae bacterium]
YCFFYHYSLNLMKQCVAVAIILLGFELLKNNKFWSFIFLVLVTALIVHKTAVIALVIPFVFILSTNQKELLVYKWLNIKLSLEEKSRRRLKNLIFIAALVVIVFMLLNIKSLLLIAVQIKHSYIHQLKNLKGFELKYSNFLVMLMLLAPVVLFRRKQLKTDFIYRFYFLLHIISTLLYQFVGVSPALYRLSLYSMIFVTLEIPEYAKLFKKEGRVIAVVFYVMVLLVNFMFDVVLNSYAGVYPYSTSFFG